MKKHVKTSLAPGSRVVTEYLEKAGLLPYLETVSYTHLRAHETVLDLVCRLLLEKIKQSALQHALPSPYYVEVLVINRQVDKCNAS